MSAAPDRQAPSVPAELVASGVGPSGFTVSWSPSSDNVGVTGYEVFFGGVSQGTASATSRTFNGLTPGVAYSVTVRARDAAANWSAQTAPLSVSTVVDNEAPSVPSNFAATSVASTRFTTSWSPASDNVGVTQYQVSNGPSWIVTLASPPLTFADLQPFSTHSLTIRAGDSAGNWSPWSAPITVTVGPPSSGPYFVSAGENQAMVVRGDGSVWGWGQGYGFGAAPIYFAPASGLAGGKAVAVGGSHFLILQEYGTVLATGANDSGQIANGTLTQPISGLPIGLTAIAAGGAHSLALSGAQEIYAWGANASGQIGNGKTTNVTSPAKLSKITGVRQIAAGFAHSLALKADGTVLAWGANSHGQIGNGGSANQTAPLAVSGLTGVSAIAAAGNYSAALKTDGTVWVWGDNTSGQLGLGSRVHQNRPVQVPGLTGVASIALGSRHAVVLKTDGSLWAWGGNLYRQLGDGTDLDRLVPTRVTVLASATKVVAGGRNTYAVDAQGLLRSWGDFQDGRLGDGGGSLQQAPFVDLLQLTRLDGDSLTSMALRRDGSVWWWGQNTDGRMTGGAASPRFEPTRVEGLSSVAQLAWAPLALRQDGSAWTWGKNNEGQLGDGSTTDRGAPQPVPGLGDVVQVVGGAGHRLALKSDGTVWAWGRNNYGQVGDGSTAQRNLPVQVPGLSDIVWIEAAGDNSFAVASNGYAWSWGYDWWASGNRTGASSSIPVRVAVNNVAKVSSNGRQTLFLTRSGTAYICGHESLGVGPWYGSSEPLPLPSEMSGLVEVSAKTGARVRAADGRLWAWPFGGAVNYIQPVTDISNATTLRSMESGYLYLDGQVARPTVAPMRPAGFASLASQVAGVRVAPSPDDADGDGLPDAWEMLHFGGIARFPAGDDDSDGLSNVQEYVRSTNPLLDDPDGDSLTDLVDEYPEDYYNNAAPALAVVGGDQQQGPVGQFNSAPFDVAVWSADGQLPLANAPVTFEVVTGGGLLGADRSGSPAPLPVQSYLTDEDGTARSYYRQPAEGGVVSTIRVTAGLAQVDFSTTSVSPGADADGNGLPDPWEEQYFGSIGVNPQGDADGDGASNLQEHQNGTSPIDYYDGVLPRITSLVANNTPAVDGMISVRVARAADGVALANAPVTFSVTTGLNEISADPGGAPGVLLNVRTDAQGVARVYLLAPVLRAQTALTDAASGAQHVSLTLQLKPAAVTDVDRNGLPDWWEVKHFGVVGVDASADPDTDGASNRQEYERGTAPSTTDLPPGDPASLRVFTPSSR